jgi:hypothetical protein
MYGDMSCSPGDVQARSMIREGAGLQAKVEGKDVDVDADGSASVDVRGNPHMTVPL